MSLKWHLHQDGSFDVRGGEIELRNAYPAADGQSLHPIQAHVEEKPNGGAIRYELKNGRLDLVLSGNENELVLESEWTGEGHLPHRFAPMGDAELSGAARIFRQGRGFMGHTGFRTLPHPEDIDSFTVTGLLSQGGQTLCVSSRDLRRFQQESRWYPGKPGVSPPRFDAAFRTEEIPIGKGAVRFPALYLTQGDDPWCTLRQTAGSIALEMGARNAFPPSYHWCSWYYLYYHLSEDLLEEYVSGFQSLNPPVPLQTMQIDAGYCPHHGDWLLPSHKFPNGMKPAFQRIAKVGYRPGIWIGPFMVGNRSRLFQQHPDWVLRDRAGNPHAEWRRYGEIRNNDYRDEETYVLDTSHPDAMEYLRGVFREFRKNGAEFFKTDFLDWGYQDSSLFPRTVPGKTSVEYLRDVLAMIREEIGEESYWLACIAPFAPLIGYADAIRVAGDVSPYWPACANMFEETEGCQYFNNVWYQMDPDAIIVRRQHNEMGETECRSLSLWMGMLGGLVNTSDPLHELDADRLDLWRFLQPSSERWTARFPRWGSDVPLKILVRDYPDRRAHAMLLLNRQECDVTERIVFDEFLGEADWHCYEWGPEGSEPLGPRSELIAELAPHQSRLLYLTRRDDPPGGMTLGGAMNERE